jgi:hypothetical protein
MLNATRAEKLPVHRNVESAARNAAGQR